MLELVDYMRIVSLQLALNRIAEHVHNQKMAVYTLKQLENFAVMKRQYLSEFNTQPYEFRE